MSLQVSMYCNAAAVAKSLQSCPTLCDPIDGSPPGSSVPRTLQARILEWVAVSFSNAWMYAKSLQSCLTLCNTMDSSPSCSCVHGILHTRILEWVAISFSILLCAFLLALALLNPIGLGCHVFIFICFYAYFDSLFLFLLSFISYSEICCLASICLFLAVSIL